MSSTQTYLRRLTAPVSVSTSMAARWVPWGNEKFTGSNVASASMEGSNPSGRLWPWNAAKAVAQCHPLVRALDREPAAGELEVVGIGLEQVGGDGARLLDDLSLIHISEPTRRTPISYAVFCLKKKKKIKL